MNLYAGKVLMIDLSSGKISVEPLRTEWVREYWGCWGLGLRYYCDMVQPDIEPLAPENPIVFMTGPFCGTMVPLTSRFSMISKSPYTGTIYEANTGGAFGPELKFAGYDGFIVKGKADRPVFLKIEDDRVSLESAEAVSGRGIFATEEFLKEAVGSPEAKTLAIGPAGENCIGYSCIGSEAYRQFGRAGAGALLGSKNLKGVVCRGTGGVRVADVTTFLEKVRQYEEENIYTDDNLWANTDGTPVLVDLTNDLGIHPTRNYRFGVNEHKDALNSDAIKKAKVSARACTSCPLACGKFTHINGAEVEGPEYETLCLSGSNCGMNDLEQVIRFNRLCDDLGLDTMTGGSVIALAMDLTESGRHDFNLKFGESGEYLKVVEEIAMLSTERGRELAMGSKKLAEKYHAEDMAAEVKGLEVPAYEPRGNYGMGIAYATSERGACHLRAFPVDSPDRFDIEIMAKEVADSQNFNAIKWSMCICDFWGSVSHEIMADLLSVGLGEPVTAEELTVAGERIWNITRLFNLGAGFTAADDILPKKMMEQPLGNGPAEGRVFLKDDFDRALKIYYSARGWDEQGVPKAEKLVELGLDQIRI